MICVGREQTSACSSSLALLPACCCSESSFAWLPEKAARVFSRAAAATIPPALPRAEQARNLNNATMSALSMRPAVEVSMSKKKGGASGTSAAVRKTKGKRGNGAQKLKQKKK
jgi:hypothetical protein